MRDLSFHSSDGSSLVLETPDGEKVRLIVDESIRSAIKQAYGPTHNNLISPREIQDAVREGISIDDIVASSGADYEYVAKFAAPVLDELQHMIETALSVRIETGADRFNEPQFQEFGDFVRDRSRAYGDTEISWSAYRETPLTWRITATFSNTGVATWSFDPRKFSLSPENDLAVAIANAISSGDSPIPKLAPIPQVAPTITDTPSESTTLLDAFRKRREAAAELYEPAEEPAEAPQLEVVVEEIVTETPAELHAVDEPEEVLEDSTPDEPTASPKKGRAPMPSWDEIVFGAKNDD